MTSSIWNIPPHTKAKHVLLKAYLDQWLPILVQYGPQHKLNRLIYVDGFAGPGIYKGGEPGSPLVALDSVVNSNVISKYGGVVEMVFVESDQRRFATLSEQLNRYRDDPQVESGRVVVEPYQEEFATVLARLIAKSATRDRRMEAMLAFVDPFGFSGVDMRQVTSLLQYPRCELIFNFMVDSVVRFRNHSNSGIQQGILDLFGGDDYLSEFATGGVSYGLAEVFMRKVAELGQFEFVREFKMINERGKNNFIVFATHNIKGLEAMKEAMWKVDPEHGKRFSDIEKNPLFASVPDLRGFKDGIYRKFQGKRVVVGDIENFVIKGDFRVAHLREHALEPLEHDGSIGVERTGKHGYPSDRTWITFR